VLIVNKLAGISNLKMLPFVFHPLHELLELRQRWAWDGWYF